MSGEPITLIDANGNATNKKPCYCKAVAKRLAVNYETDAHGRIMVNLSTTNRVVFFERDERRFSKWVRAHVKFKPQPKENP